MSSLSSTSTATSYWCYSCSCFVRARSGEPMSCPDCHGGFVEEIGNTSPATTGAAHRHRITTFGDGSFPAAGRLGLGTRHRRRASVGQNSPFNPVIVLRGSAPGGNSNDGSSGGFELFYDDGAGAGLRPLPQSMSDFLMGPGFDQLLDHLSQIENSHANRVRSRENTPASKAAIESLATITITDRHILKDSYCAVCMEAFELGGEAWEIPCKHFFHHDCIFPWLSLRNSCPVCRHELPTDFEGMAGGASGQVVMSNEDNSSALAIWRLSSGGFAVGRHSGFMRAGDRHLPLVYTDTDSSFSVRNAPRRILWPSRGTRSGEHRGVGRMVHSFFSIFRCFSPLPASLSSSRLSLPSSSSASRV